MFAAGFVTRPLGSIAFGHMADSLGRKPCLVATVSIMGAATAAIGCLPTYAHIGIAAPVLLALLRAVQGLAIGGEFGAALVFLHEIAPAQHKALSGSGGFAASMAGIGLGVAATMAVVGACSPAQLARWGWRVPLLLASLTAAASLLLRIHMREPAEFLEARAAAKALAARAAEMRAAAAAASSRGGSVTSGGGGRGGVARSARASDAAGGGGGPPVARAASRLAASFSSAASVVSHKAAAALERSAEAFAFVGVMRDHWREALAQVCFEASVSVCFWLGTSYMPTFFEKNVGMPQLTALGMLLANLIAMMPVMLLTGRLCDRPRAPRVAAAVVAYAALAALSVPMFHAFQRGGPAACWALQAAFMLLLAVVLGVVPSAMAALYPPLRRATGFSFAHNVAMSLLGGLAPTVVTVRGCVLVGWLPGGGGAMLLGCCCCLLRLPLCRLCCCCCFGCISALSPTSSHPTNGRLPPDRRRSPSRLATR